MNPLERRSSELKLVPGGLPAPVEYGAGHASQWSRGRVHTLVIASGRGGVGKSNLAVNLAVKQWNLASDERALAMLTSSDLVALRLGAAEGVAPETHATYRYRPGGTTAVLTLSHFAPAPPGETYRAWILEPSGWSRLGDLHPGPDGKARLIVEGPRFAARPQALEITRESAPGSQPAGPVVVRWSADDR